MIEEVTLVSAIIMAISTSILALATIFYAITNRRLWLNMEKQVQRPRREDEVKFIIKPIIDRLDNELNHLKRRWFPFFSNGLLLFDEFKDDISLNVVFNEFLNKKPKLKNRYLLKSLFFFYLTALYPLLLLTNIFHK